MKKLFVIFLLVIISVKTFAKDGCFQFGLQDSFQVESTKLEDKPIVNTIAQTFGAYLSFGICEEDENIGFGVSNTFSVGRVLNEVYINNRLLLGSSLMPFSEGLLYNFITGIIIQPEWESSSIADSFHFLIGAGIDFQLFSNAGSQNFGFDCSISLSAYPIAIASVTQNSKTSFLKIEEYSKFCIGFSFGVGLATNHIKN